MTIPADQVRSWEETSVRKTWFLDECNVPALVVRNT